MPADNKSLISVLASILSGKSTKEADDIYAEARKSLGKSIEEIRNEAVADLKGQKAELKRLEAHKSAGLHEEDFYEYYVDPLIKLVEEMSYEEVERIPDREGHLKVLMVFKPEIISVGKTLEMIRLNGETGYTRLNLNKISVAPGIELPSSLSYLIFDIEDGRKMKGRSVDDCLKQFTEEGRSGLTVAEVLGHAFQTPASLKEVYMDCAGSLFGSDRVPNLFLVDGRPGLSSCNSVYTCGRWGSASCGSRLGLRS